MDSINLKAFIAVAETRSFSRAADQLYLTQPAISKRISSLERELGNKLFNRIGRSIDLTPAGSALLPRARHILDEIRIAKITIDNLSCEIKGTLHFGMSHHISLRRMPTLLQQFARRYPDVELNIAFLGSEEANLLVSQGRLEFALITLPDKNASEMEHISIWSDPLTIVTAADFTNRIHHLEDLRTLTGLPAILPTNDTETRRLIERTFFQRGVALHVGMETNNLETIKMMVTSGIGWSVLPATMVDAGVRAHSVPELTMKRTLGAVIHPKKTLSNAANAMLELIRSEGGQLK